MATEVKIITIERDGKEQEVYEAVCSADPTIKPRLPKPVKTEVKNDEVHKTQSSSDIVVTSDEDSSSVAPRQRRK